MMGRKKHGIHDIDGASGQESSPLGTPGGGFRRRSHYQKYFEGYTEVRRLNAKGRAVTERYYTRPWIVSGLSRRNYWLVRLLYACLTAASAALFITALSQQVPGNDSAVVVLPGAVSAVLMLLLVTVTLMYIFVERKMTVWEHATSTKRLKIFALLTAIAQALTALTLTGFALVTGQEIGKSLGCAGLALLAACCSGVLYFTERRMPYTQAPNDTKLPTGESYEIQ